MNEINIDFCFYDDPDYASDADCDSSILRESHRQLWSKELPSGDRVEWLAEAGTMYLTYAARGGSVRVSSDTIATTHSRYVPELWAGLSPTEQTRYDRAFYTIGGFIIFPVHGRSLNQQRGWHHQIADRFDLTLECIRRYYLGEPDNPLAEVLSVDADFFGLFGDGPAGFAAYVNFFHLQDLVSEISVRWLDGFDGDKWNFETIPPLPQSASAYVRYLENVMTFVGARNQRIRSWCKSSEAHRSD